MAADRGEFVFEENLTSTVQGMIAAYDALERKLAEPLRAAGDNRGKVLGNLFNELRDLARLSDQTTRQIRKDFQNIAAEQVRTGKTLPTPNAQPYLAAQGRNVGDIQTAVTRVLNDYVGRIALRNVDLTEVVRTADQGLAQVREIARSRRGSLEKDLGRFNFAGVGGETGRSTVFGDNTRESTVALRRLLQIVESAPVTNRGLRDDRSPGTRGRAAAAADGSGGEQPNRVRNESSAEAVSARVQKQALQGRLDRFFEEVNDGLAVNFGRFIYRPNAADTLDDPRFVRRSDGAGATPSQRAGLELQVERYNRKRDFDARLLDGDDPVRQFGRRYAEDTSNGDLFDVRSGRKLERGTEEYANALVDVLRVRQDETSRARKLTESTEALDRTTRLLAEVQAGRARFLAANIIETGLDKPLLEREYFRVGADDRSRQVGDKDTTQNRARSATRDGKELAARLEADYAQAFQQQLAEGRRTGTGVRRVGTTRFAADDDENIFDARSGRLLDRASDEYAAALITVREVRQRETTAAQQAILSELSVQRANELLARVREGQARIIAGNVVELGLDKPVEERDFYRLSGDRRSALPSNDNQRQLDEQRSREIDARAAEQAQRRADRAQAQQDRIAERRRAVIDAEVEADSRRGLANNFVGGLTSSGFGNNNSSRGFQGTFDGLAQSAGVTAKYAALSTILYALAAGANQAVQEFLDMEDSLVEVQIAMESTEDVSVGLINSLSGISAVAGANLGQSLDVAASGMRLFGDATEDSDLRMQQIGATFADTASKLAVLAKTDITDAAGNLKAIATGFDIPIDSADRITDAIVGAKLVGGGDEKEVFQAVASVAAAAGDAGFNVEDTSVITSALQAATDASGRDIGTRFSRILSIVGGQSGQAGIAQFNQGLDEDQRISQGPDVDPATQLRELIPLYDDLSEAQKGFLVNRLGGSGNTREFRSFFEQAGDSLRENAADYGFAGKGAEEFQRRLDNLRQSITQIVGELKVIAGAVGQSGLFSPLMAGVEVFKVALTLVRQFLTAFQAIPAAVRNTAGAILGIVVALKAIQALRNGGLGELFGKGEARFLPAQALARQELRRQRASSEVSDATVDRLTNAREYEEARQRTAPPENAVLAQRQLAAASATQRQALRLEQLRKDASDAEESAAQKAAQAQTTLLRTQASRDAVAGRGGNTDLLDQRLITRQAELDNALDGYRKVVEQNVQALKGPSAQLDDARRQQAVTGEQGGRLAVAQANIDRQIDSVTRSFNRADGAIVDQINDNRTTAAAQRGLHQVREREERRFNQEIARLRTQRLQAENAALAGTLGPQTANTKNRFLQSIDDRGIRGSYREGLAALNQSSLGRSINNFGRAVDAAFIKGSRDRGALQQNFGEYSANFAANGRRFAGSAAFGEPIAPFSSSQGRFRDVITAGRGLGRGIGDAGAFVGRAGLNALDRGARRVGGALTSEFGKFGLALAGAGAALTAFNTLQAQNLQTSKIQAATAAVDETDDLREAAANVRAPAQTAADSFEGDFLGRLLDSFFNLGDGQSAAREGLAFADRLDEQADQLEASRKTTAGGDRPQDALDLSSIDALKASLNALGESGRDAETQFLALNAALEEAAAAAQGSRGPLSAEQQLEITSTVAKGTGQNLDDYLTDLEERSTTEGSLLGRLLTDEEGSDPFTRLLGDRGNAFTSLGTLATDIGNDTELAGDLRQAQEDVVSTLLKENPEFDPNANEEDAAEYRRRINEAFTAVNNDKQGKPLGGNRLGGEDGIKFLVDSAVTDLQDTIADVTEAQELLGDVAATAALKIEVGKARAAGAAARAEFGGFFALTEEQRKSVQRQNVAGGAYTADASQVEAAIRLDAADQAIADAKKTLDDADGVLDTKEEIEAAEGVLENAYAERTAAQIAMRDANAAAIARENALVLSSIPAEDVGATIAQQIKDIEEVIASLPVNSPDRDTQNAELNRLRQEQARQQFRVGRLQANANVNPRDDVAGAQARLGDAQAEVQRLKDLGLTTDDEALLTAMRAVVDAENAVFDATLERTRGLADVLSDPEDNLEKARKAREAADEVLAKVKANPNSTAEEIQAATNASVIAGREESRAENRDAADAAINSLGIGDTLGELYQNAQALYRDAETLPVTNRERDNMIREANRMMRDFNNQTDAITYQHSLAAVGIGDTVARGYLEAEEAYRIAREAAAANAPDAAALLESARQTEYQAQQNDIDVQGAEALAGLDPRDELGSIRQQRANAEGALALAKSKGDRAKAAAAQQQINELNQQEQDFLLGRVQDSRLAAVFPGDQLGEARANLSTAQENLARAHRGQANYDQLVAEVRRQEQAYAVAKLESASLARQANIDLSDPAAVAKEAAQAARERLAQLRAAGASQDQINAAAIEAENADNAAEQTAFSQNLQAINDLESIGRITHRQKLAYLEGERDRLLAISDRTYQQNQQLIQIEQALQAASEQLNGQFNLGDIKLPTVYEVRRSLQQQGGGYISNSVTDNSYSGNTINVDGADFGAVVDYINKYFGGGNNVRSTSRRS